jgi:hypothetical protein
VDEAYPLGKSELSLSSISLIASFKMSGFYSDLVAPDGSYKYFIDNEWKVSTSGKSVGIVNPTTNEVQFKVQGNQCSVSDSFRLLSSQMLEI